MAKTLYDKLFDQHVVAQRDDGSVLLYIDRHIIHEVTSPQAFEGLRLAGRTPWRVSANVATPDHNVPTTIAERAKGVEGIVDDTSRIQVKTLDDNCDEFGIVEFKINDDRQGIVHVVGPETGASLPGMTIVCGDSHTSTHGALAALAQGIGTSEVEHVLATQCLVAKKMKNMRVNVVGVLDEGLTAKDIALAVIGAIGTAGGTGYAIEFAGSAIEALSVEGRMTLCNMAIEAGARAGLVAVDDKTLEYVKGRPLSPKADDWDAAVSQWRELVSDEGAHFDAEVELDAASIKPQVTWGTSPEQVIAVDQLIPKAEDQADTVSRDSVSRALSYMGLKGGEALSEIGIDRVFIGSCTNSRIEDLRAAAKVFEGRHVASSVKEAIIVPGSQQVKKQAEQEGLHTIFEAAGAQWREPGCSMCLGMNADRLGQGEHCASTSNRNFEGRQGAGGRTHLVSPAMAAAAAVAGTFVDFREL